MNPRVIAALILVVAVAAAVVLISNRSPEEAAETTPEGPTPAAGEQATVTVRNMGGKFVPAEVTVEAGQSVRFVNDDDRPMQIASDPHPTHTDLEGLESEGIEPGASYLFIFNRKGSWGFHNHLNPSQTGRVIVL